MKVSQVVLALAAMVLAKASAAAVPKLASTTATTPAEAFRPSGRLILLPARLEEPTNDAKTTPTTTATAQESAQILDSGEYYVLLADGRLQMVKYTTAALTEATEKTDKSSGELNLAEPFAQFQIEYFQLPQDSSAQKQAPAQVKAEEKENADESTGFQANLQYRQVKPISGPVYAYNPTPLVRILKK